MRMSELPGLSEYILSKIVEIFFALSLKITDSKLPRTTLSSYLSLKHNRGGQTFLLESQIQTQNSMAG